VPGASGQAPAALLPKADQCVLVLAEADVSWHLVDVPKAPAGRLRDALAGVMEEVLLEESEGLHFALAADATPGRRGWVAITDRARLAAALAALEEAGPGVERVVPALAPSGVVGAGAEGASPAPGGWKRAHFHMGVGAEGSGPADDTQPWLSLSGPAGACVMRLGGGLARARLSAGDFAEVQWSCTPSAAQAAERWLGHAVPLMSDGERLFEAVGGANNLRQFDLVARRRGTRALSGGLKRLLTREWRPVRVGLAALVLVQLVGLNAYAWLQRQELAQRRVAMNELLLASHPGVRTVLDAPLQMQRETDRLRAAAGRVGAADLESLLAAAAAAWPDGMGPVQNVRFETGSLSLAATAWTEPQMQQFRDRLRGAACSVEFVDGRAVVSPSAARRAPSKGAL
jgi:general secretion pathway protein L